MKITVPPETHKCVSRMIIPHVEVKRNREKKSYPQKMETMVEIYPYIVDNALKIKHCVLNFQNMYLL